jgi:hypothetical protein
MKTYFPNPLLSKRIILLFPNLWKLFLTYQIDFSLNHRVKLSRKEIVDLKIKKYFFAAGLSGVIISHSIHGKRNGSAKNRTDYSLLLSYWAVLLITLDSYSDLEKNDKRKSITANLVCAKQIIETILQNGIVIPNEILTKFYLWLNSYGSDLVIDTHCSIMSSIIYFSECFSQYFSKCLNHISDEAILKKNLNEIIIALMNLMDGQIKSLNQSTCSSIYNWQWYYYEVLKNKFDNIFISALYIFPKDESQILKTNLLIEGIKAVNELFLHRQILDDLIDFEEDIDNGIMATPTYILLAYDDIDNNQIDEELAKSILNKIEISKCYKKGTFSALWNKDMNLLKEIIIKNKILNIFFETIENTERSNLVINKIETIISTRPEIGDSIIIYYRRTIKSYLKFKHSYQKNTN